MRIFKESQRGSSTILVSMLLVTLMVFGLLSLTTSASELRLAERSGRTNKIFYSLDSEGVRFLHDVKMLVKDAYLNSRENYAPGAFFSQFEALLDKRLEGMNREIDDTNPEKPFMVLRRTIILEDDGINRYLNITLRIFEPEGKDINKACEITEWRLSQDPFKYNETIELWDGKIQ